jgi:hypothetical protein
MPPRRSAGTSPKACSIRSIVQYDDEPTGALEKMLIASDLGDDLPADVFRPPFPATYIPFGETFGQAAIPAIPIETRTPGRSRAFMCSRGCAKTRPLALVTIVVSRGPFSKRRSGVEGHELPYMLLAMLLVLAVVALVQLLLTKSNATTLVIRWSVRVQRRKAATNKRPESRTVLSRCLPESPNKGPTDLRGPACDRYFRVYRTVRSRLRQRDGHTDQRRRRATNRQAPFNIAASKCQHAWRSMPGFRAGNV